MIVSIHLICIVFLCFRCRAVFLNHAPNISERPMELHYMATSPATVENNSSDDDDILYPLSENDTEL